MSISVDYHQSIHVIQISVDGDSVFLNRSQANEFLGKFMGALAASAENDNHSRKAPNIRLADRTFACDPDESLGAA